jgi:hypothetical protein
MSLNELLAPSYKPWSNCSLNSLFLQQASNQLGFQPSGTGNRLFLSASSPANDLTVITLPDPGVIASKFLLNIGSVSNVTATTVLTSADSGKVFSVNSAAAASSYTLPAPTTAGLKYSFYIGGAVSNAVTISSSGANISGQAIAADATACGGSGITAGVIAAKTNIIFSSSSAVGDHISLFSNGTNYIASAFVAVHSTITAS